MQHIPDNEFDRLFKDRLMDAEVQPGADLWDRIAPQITTKKKRNMSVYWSAAATVLIGVSAGLLFKPQEKIALHAPIVSVPVEVSAPAGHPGVSADHSAKAENQITAPEDQSGSTDQINHASLGEKESHASSNLIEYEKSLVALQPVEEDRHHTIKSDEKPETTIATMVEPAISENALANGSKPANTEAEMTALNEPAELEQQSRPRIRNAGDLVNFVVDKLDKREQKFVEFRTDDDEGTSLVAINIGPLKINQRRSR